MYRFRFAGYCCGLAALLMLPAAGLAIEYVEHRFENPEEGLDPSDNSAQGDLFGRYTAISGGLALIGAQTDQIGDTTYGSVRAYRRVGARWKFHQDLTPRDGSVARYGTGIAISGDTAIIGVNQNEQLYVWEYNNNSWTRVQTLAPSGDQNADSFGQSISIDGDVFAVGAPRDTTNGTDAGAAYIFEKSGAAWSETMKLLPDDGAEEDRFGEAVAISGNAAVVGAQYNNVNGRFSGSAYVFRRTDDSWNQEARLTPSDAMLFQQFGEAVAIYGDTIAIGTPLDDENADTSGAVYIFEYANEVWSEVAKVTAPDAGYADLFGSSVALWGDNLIIGSPGADGGARDSGAVYHFINKEGTWTLERKIGASDAQLNSAFGQHSIAITQGAIIVGALLADAPEPDSGIAYIYELVPGDAWVGY